jgi:hypothetical protein
MDYGLLLGLLLIIAIPALKNLPLSGIFDTAAEALGGDHQSVGGESPGEPPNDSGTETGEESSENPPEESSESGEEATEVPPEETETSEESSEPPPPLFTVILTTIPGVGIVSMHSITYGDGIYVGVGGDDDGGAIFTSSDGGLTWERQTI